MNDRRLRMGWWATAASRGVESDSVGNDLPAAFMSWASLLVVVMVALLLRVVTLLTTVDIPGDGPSRAIEAYEWSRRPFLPTWGWWPPGFLFLSGSVNFALPQPLIASRLLNVVLGTLTVPFLFLLARRAFDPFVAFFGAVALAFFPLHVELSASSLAETGFALELIAGALFVTIAFGDRVRPLALTFALASLAYASMTRYEAWWLLPLFPVYAWWRSRSWAAALLVATLLAVFPLAWTVGNYRAVGDPFLGFTVAKKGALVEGVRDVSFLSAVLMLVHLFVAELGWLLAAAVLIGTIIGAWRTHPHAPQERVLYLTLAGLFWVPMCYFAVIRGSTLYSRYLLLGYVLLLPCAVLPFRRALRRRSGIAAALLLATLVSLALTGRYLTPKYVTHREPTEIQTLAAWLERNTATDAFFLLTDMGWDASYLALYWPQVSSRRAIVSTWMEDHELRMILRERQPALLVTRDSDHDQRARIAAYLDADLDSAPVIHQIGTIRIQDIRSSVTAARDRQTTRAPGR